MIQFNSIEYRRDCPYCGTALQNKGLPLISCDCGWYDRNIERTDKRKSDVFCATVLVVAGVMLALSYHHVATWGSFALKIPVLRAKQMTGVLSGKGYEELAQACTFVNKWSCAENAYERAFQKSRDPNQLMTLGDLQTKLSKSNEARMTYARYFENGGKEAKAMNAYAALLESAHDDQKALTYYRKAIKARPEVLPIQATGGILRILIKQGKYRQAQNLIVKFHHSAENAKGYFNTELEQLRGRLDTKAKNGHADDIEG